MRQELIAFTFQHLENTDTDKFTFTVEWIQSTSLLEEDFIEVQLQQIL